LFELVSQFAAVGMACCRASHDHEVLIGELVTPEPEGFPDLATNAVPHDRSQ